MNITRNGILQTFAFMLVTLAATAALVAAGLSGEADAGRTADCVSCARP